MQLEKINFTLSKEFKIFKDEITEQPLKILADKINEIIDVLNEKKNRNWKPKKSEVYFWNLPTGPYPDCWEDKESDYLNLKLGNCFRTYEEAQKRYEEIISS